MVKPVRLQLSRAKGFSLQTLSLATNGLPAVNVARPGPWGNPFVVGKNGSRDYCVRLYGDMAAGYILVSSTPSVEEQQKTLAYAKKNLWQLKASNLACWCRHDQSCHADILLESAAAKVCCSCEAAAPARPPLDPRREG